jgi:hypothetical protein
MQITHLATRGGEDHLRALEAAASVEGQEPTHRHHRLHLVAALHHINTPLHRIAVHLRTSMHLPLNKPIVTHHLVITINRHPGRLNQRLLALHLNQEHPEPRHPRMLGKRQEKRHAREKKSARPGKPTKRGGKKLLVDCGSLGKRRHESGNRERRTERKGNSETRKPKNEKPRKRRDYSRRHG